MTPQINLPEPQITQNSGIKHDDILLTVPHKRLTIPVPKPKHIEMPEETTKHEIQRVKPIVMQNGSLRCPAGTRRTKDGHWCVPKEYINVPYLREIIDEIAKKSQHEAQVLSPAKTPHAIILDKHAQLYPHAVKQRAVCCGLQTYEHIEARKRAR